MTKQDRARERNWLKCRLMAGFRYSEESVTPEELVVLDEINNSIAVLLKYFSANSRRLGMNVPERCWCSKIAKFKPTDPDSLQAKLHPGKLFCKHHKD